MSKKFNNISDLIKELDTEEEIPFLWSGIQKGSFGFIFGPAKSGKTILCENIGLSLAIGRKQFLGMDLLQEEHNVLFIGLEEFWRQRVQRNKKQIEKLGLKESAIINFNVVNEEFPRFFINKNDWKILEETITESEANVVFIDSLTRIFNGEIENSSPSRDTSIRLREIVNDTGITLIVIHHSPKLGGKPISIDSLAGSRVLAQEADFMLGLNRALNGTRYLKEIAFRYKQENEDTVTTFEIDNNLWISSFTETTEFDVLLGQDRRKSTYNVDIIEKEIKKVAQLSSNGSFKTADIEKEVSQNIPRSTYYDNMKKLQDAGKITQTGKGEYKYNSTQT